MIGVVIPTYGNLGYARRAVESAFRSDESCKVAVIDDASPDWDPRYFEEFYEKYPGRFFCHRYSENGGVTRSWEKGYEILTWVDCKHIVFGNSDLIFSKDSLSRMSYVLENTEIGLVGPLSNGPGKTTKNQDIFNWLKSYRPRDEYQHIDYVSDWLLENVPPSRELIISGLNGFCMMASVEKMEIVKNFRGTVFNPTYRYRMVRSEDELCSQLNKLKIEQAVVCSSFVFHYRSVTRGDAHKHGAWYRMESEK